MYAITFLEYRPDFKGTKFYNIIINLEKIDHMNAEINFDMISCIFASIMIYIYCITDKPDTITVNHLDIPRIPDI